MIKNCYIHIPFCDRICSYCDFCKMVKYDKYIDKYLDALKNEIIDKYEGDVLDTIYIGGGTPSCLNLGQLDKLFSILNILKKSDNVEYTIEGNFESTNEDKLLLYKKYGINRLSFGIESINRDNLKLLERELDDDKVRNTISIARKLGFNNINVDLMYAFPNESMGDLKEDLKYIFSLDVEHISTYSLIIEDHTKLKINGYENISTDLDNDMYKYICIKMRNNGYDHYEISNFSKKGFESKHNLCYWNNANYYGFGLGASSYILNQRITNTRSLNHYGEKKYTREIEYLNEKSEIEYEIILNLRKNDGIDLNRFKEKYKKELKEVYNYKDLINNNLLIEENRHLFIPEDKWYISNSIIVCILEREIYG
ncbi:MAG: radical SAM family heme chaperone HemW [Bacilli bacterium]|nr:radical SAM family heme chaperone HemW [Bacilli bacterium]